MSIYPPLLTPLTAPQAYSYLPDDRDYQMVAVVNPARANIPYAKHAVLELRSESTGKRRKFRTGKMMIPLMIPTSDFGILELGLARVVAIAEKVNEWIEQDWIKSIRFP